MVIDPSIHSLIEALHRAPCKCGLAVAGGGAGAVAMLLAVPGASRTVLEVVVPYDDRALAELLGRRPERFCSSETGRALAERSYARARWLAPQEPVVGVGCTVSLATDRPKRGDHRLHVAVISPSPTLYSLTLTKGARDRAGEEEIVDLVLLNALAEAFGIEERLALRLLPGESLEVERPPDPSPMSAFFRGDLEAVCVKIDGQASANRSPPAILVPGSFNPLHDAHCELGCAAAGLQGQWAFELSTTNVDKPPLSREEVMKRVGQFAWKAPLWLTRAPTFLKKAALFPGTVFAVGADTAQRIVDVRYYGDSTEKLAEALAVLRARACRFLVAGRVSSGGRFLELKDLPIPPAFRDVFEAVPESLFRRDLSSTYLRTRRDSANDNLSF
jgi:hypothetical protein